MSTLKTLLIEVRNLIEKDRFEFICNAIECTPAYSITKYEALRLIEAELKGYKTVGILMRAEIRRFPYRAEAKARRLQILDKLIEAQP